MCQSKVEKEEVFLNQNAAGGDNTATVDQIKGHLASVNYLMIFLAAVIVLGLMIIVWCWYKKTHKKWMRREIGRAGYFRRSFGWRDTRGNPPEPRAEGTAGVRLEFPKPKFIG